MSRDPEARGPDGPRVPLRQGSQGSAREGDPTALERRLQNARPRTPANHEGPGAGAGRVPTRVSPWCAPSGRRAKKRPKWSTRGSSASCRSRAWTARSSSACGGRSRRCGLCARSGRPRSAAPRRNTPSAAAACWRSGRTSRRRSSDAWTVRRRESTRNSAIGCRWR